MNISSNYYNYYNQIYQLNSLSNSQGSTEDSSSSENETKAISSTRTRSYIPSGESSLADLNYNGRMVMNSLKIQGTDSSEIFQNIDKINEDIDSIKSTDIDSMSADELKEILTDLTSDMKFVSTPYGRPSSANVDLDNMSESDMKAILKKIQEQANSMPTIDEFDPIL